MSLDPIPDDVLSALAAGELPAAEADAVRRRAAAEPELARRLAAAERVERALRTDDLLPVPLALLATVLERVRSEPALRPDAASSPRRTPTAVRRFGAIAATLLVSFGLWAAISGYEPTAAFGLPAPAPGPSLAAGLGDGLRPPSAPLYDLGEAWTELAPAPAEGPVPSLLWIAGGLALLALAGALARRLRPLLEAATSLEPSLAPFPASPPRA